MLLCWWWMSVQNSVVHVREAKRSPYQTPWPHSEDTAEMWKCFLHAEAGDEHRSATSRCGKRSNHCSISWKVIGMHSSLCFQNTVCWCFEYVFKMRFLILSRVIVQVWKICLWAGVLDYRGKQQKHWSSAAMKHLWRHAAPQKTESSVEGAWHMGALAWDAQSDKIRLRGWLGKGCSTERGLVC